MKILVTGNLGYIGSVLTPYLRSRYPKAKIIGFDMGLFSHCITRNGRLPETMLDTQHYGDIRNIDKSILDGVDCVIQLAAISNDPIGVKFEAVTEEINFQSSLRLAKLSKDAGVKNFVFASSCSVYGTASGAPRTELDEVNPLTAYARSKIVTEQSLKQQDWGEMVVTCLRFATACGMSPKLRLDLVLNDFVAGALLERKITVLSDGSPWRPLIHVSDMARAIDWACFRSANNGGAFLIVNTGSNEWNYQVKNLAEAVSDMISGTTVSINLDALPDKRSYKVDFSLFNKLAPDHIPKVLLPQAIAGLRDGLVDIGFVDPNFRDSELIRLNVLNRFLDLNTISANLRWSV